MRKFVFLIVLIIKQTRTSRIAPAVAQTYGGTKLHSGILLAYCVAIRS